MPTLVQIKTHWSSECDWEEYRIISQSLEETQKEVNLLIKFWEYVGEDETWVAGSLKQDNFRILEISDAQAGVLTTLLGDRFGTGMLSDLFDEDSWWKWDDNGNEYDEETMGSYEGWDDDN